MQQTDRRSLWIEGRSRTDAQIRTGGEKKDEAVNEELVRIGGSSR